MTNYTTASLPRVATLSLLCGLLACDVGNKDIGSDELGMETDTSSTGDTDTDTDSSGTDGSSGTDTDSSGTDGSSGTDSTDDMNSSDDMDASDTGPAITGCECIDLQSQADFEDKELPHLPTCGESLCPKIVLTGNMFDVVVENPEALDCALAALRDRSEGVLTWEAFVGNQETDFGYIAIVQDASAVVRNWGLQDKSYVIGAAELGELPAAAIYEACLDEPDPALRWECMRTPLVTVDLICNDGGTF